MSNSNSLCTLRECFLIVAACVVASSAQTTTISSTTIFPGSGTITQTSTISYTTTIPHSSTPSADSSWTDDSDFRKACLNSTNEWRADYDASPLSWNDTLAEVAQDWASQCNWFHSGSDSGENLAIGYSSVTEAIDGWGSEEQWYNFADGEYTERTGHFSQMVWTNTTSVGCARKFCEETTSEDSNSRLRSRQDDGERGGWLLVCEYNPGGNVQGAFDANVHNQVSDGDDDGFIGNEPKEEDDQDGGAGRLGTQACKASVAVFIAAAMFSVLF